MTDVDFVVGLTSVGLAALVVQRRVAYGLYSRSECSQGELRCFIKIVLVAPHVPGRAVDEEHTDAQTHRCTAIQPYSHTAIQPYSHTDTHTHARIS